MNNIIGIFSTKGGVGKTTTAINLASGLNEFGRKTLIVDSDIRSPNIGIFLGEPKANNTLNKVIKKEIEVKDAIYRHNSGIYSIVSSLIPEEERIDLTKINEVLKSINQGFEIVIVDGSPGNNQNTLKKLNSINSIIIVTTPEIAAVTDALRTVTIAKKLKITILGTVITRANRTEYDMTKENIEAMLGTPIIGIIPEDENIILSCKIGSPIIHSHPQSPAAYAYKKLAAYILGEEYESY